MTEPAPASGLVWEIREFCLHDGPGIRTTVFLKGCPLRCAWCHNPEGLRAEREVLFKPSRCRHCGACERVCPLADTERGRNGVPLGCTVCGACAKACPERCREICGAWWSPAALAAELKRNADVFSASHGGVTFSGGEPLRQGAFVAQTAALLHPIHLAIETSGYAPHEMYRTVVSEMDFVYQDLKHPDPVLHKKWTGVDPTVIHENLAWLMASGKPFVIRIPLIPGVNDSRETKAAFANLIARHRTSRTNLQGVELLPYHTTAGAKYPFTRFAFTPTFDPTQPSDTGTGPFKEHGLPVRVM